MLGVAGFQLLPKAEPIQAADQVTFAIIGDYGSELRGEQEVADLVSSWNPNFVGTTGDNVYSGDGVDAWDVLDRKVGRYYHEFMYPYYGRFGEGSPTGTNRFFPALGNHDWGDPGTELLTCNGQSCQGAWLDFFNLPGNGRYFDHREGPVHLFVVDDYYLDPDGHKEDSQQAQWFKNAMAASDAEWKVVLTHFAPEASVDGFGRASIRWPFAAWGADLVVSGHHHFYERLNVDGVNYIVNGLGGAGISGINRPQHPNSLFRYNGDHGAMRIVATDSQLVSEFVDTDGNVIDRFVLGADNPPVTTPTTQPTTTTTRPTTTTAAPTTTTEVAPVTTVPGANPYAGSEGRQGSIVRLYAATFLRLPDQAGLDHWHNSGLEIPVIAYSFIVSPEFSETYGAVSNTQFVTLLYNNVLAREPDAEGLAYWVGLLEASETHVSILLGFSESDEFKVKTETQ